VVQKRAPWDTVSRRKLPLPEAWFAIDTVRPSISRGRTLSLVEIDVLAHHYARTTLYCI
jgi:hypothetical protein